jgi:hypothetical protein
VNNTIPVLDVEYDFVAVIDGLPKNERITHNISEPLITFLGNQGVNQQLAECNNKNGMIKSLEHFRARAHNGERFCLHFVCHGNENGLGLKSTGEMIEWPEFTAYLQSINEVMGNALIVNMSSCKGLHGIRIVDIDNASLPFFGLTGPKSLITPEEAKRINEKYYSKQLNDKEIPTIVSEINQELGSEVLYCVISEVYRCIQLVKKGRVNTTVLSF